MNFVSSCDRTSESSHESPRSLQLREIQQVGLEKSEKKIIREDMAISLFLKKSFKPELTSKRSIVCLFGRTLHTSKSQCYALDEGLFKPLTPEEISPKTDYEVAGRKWLPGSMGEGIPKYLRKPKEGFPYALKVISANRHDLTEWANVTRKAIDDNLGKYGTMLIRGLPLVESEAVSEFSKALGYEAMAYPGGGGADRNVHDADAQVYTASEEPPQFTIELHNELGYLPTYPKKLIFYCLQEPAEGCGGFTVICDSKEFVSRLDPKIVKKLEEKQIRYFHSLPDESKSTYVSWQQTFKTKDIEEVKTFLDKGGYGYNFDKKKQKVNFWNTLPAFMPHPETGEKIWFNSVHIAHHTSLKESPMYPGEDKLDTVYSWDSTYGDGSPIELEVIQHIRACMWHSTYGFQWKTGDMLVVDNFKALHGRYSFTGDRKILAFLIGN